MSFLSMLGIGTGGEDPLAVQQRIEGQRRADALAAQQQQQQQIDFLNTLRADQKAKEDALAAQDPTATRNAALSSLSGIFGPEFESQYTPNTLTDPYETSVYNEQRASADDLINRMFKRGVLTDTGVTAARGELDKQAPRVRTQLDQIGQALLESERGKLGDIAGRARSTASNLGVGQAFDVNPYKTALDTEVGTFGSGLSDAFRAGISGDLFDTAALGNIGGAAQGAGNRPFDPDLAGTTGDSTDTTDPFSGQKPVQKRTSTVF